MFFGTKSSVVLRNPELVSELTDWIPIPDIIGYLQDLTRCIIPDIVLYL